MGPVSKRWVPPPPRPGPCNYSGEEPVYLFTTDEAYEGFLDRINEDEKWFFRAALEERMKLAMLKGEEASREQMKLLYEERSPALRVALEGFQFLTCQAPSWSCIRSPILACHPSSSLPSKFEPKGLLFLACHPISSLKISYL